MRGIDGTYILHNDAAKIMTDEHDGSVDLFASVTLLLQEQLASIVLGLAKFGGIIKVHRKIRDKGIRTG